MIYKKFQYRLMGNYLIGSFIAVVIFGSVFITQTLQIPQNDMDILVGILLISIFTMITSEGIAFHYHIKPIKHVMKIDTAPLEELRHAYSRVLRFPTLTFIRILLPHLLGLAIPSTMLTFAFVANGSLSIPYYYIGFAWIGAFLIALIHGIIEFLLATSAIKPLLKALKDQTLVLYNVDLSLEDYVLLSIRKKFFFSILLIGIFPILLYSLASFIYLFQSYPAIVKEYWQWSGIIILLVSIISFYFSILLTREVQQPIQQLQHGMHNVQNGQKSYLEGFYSDEFSTLISGFNHMAKSIHDKEAQNEELLESIFTIFAATLDARDPYTAGHSIRVANYATEIGERFGLGKEDLDILRKSALLHDIGKIGIRDQVLLKDGKLTDEEFDQIKLHPSIGADILHQIQPKEAMLTLIPGVKYHHERFDGKGYPEGLTGEKIPVFGRILAVADAYDAMTSNRPYRKGMAEHVALNIIEEGKGTQWDPTFAEIFIQIERNRISVKVDS
ncbi:HD domain-containing protein [Aquibacillus koreensis]|uniref:HD domain-containing protein n=1 Tax=Aquibacillus koreensis TaxID=279446 RepID=A0A9X3WLY7_9BACI|nr:HD domain-containing phosphohydrolase [Aquibacillus koreensis]MCT2537751.1 HD domain-containing protein [Aquibacillus koreensis]MDC3421215.1 HD domain-containing protein [Aquibacillus koreensis]